MFPSSSNQLEHESASCLEWDMFSDSSYMDHQDDATAPVLEKSQQLHNLSSQFNRKHGKPEDLTPAGILHTPEAGKLQESVLCFKRPPKRTFWSSPHAEQCESDSDQSSTSDFHLLNLPRVVLCLILKWLPLEARKSLRLTCRTLLSADRDCWMNTESFGIVKDTRFLVPTSKYRAYSLAMLKTNLREISRFGVPHSLRSVNFNPDTSGTSRCERRTVMAVSCNDMWFPLHVQEVPFSNVTDLSLRNCFMGFEELSMLSSIFPQTQRLALSEKLMGSHGQEEISHLSAKTELADRICNFRQKKNLLYANSERVILVDLCLKLFLNLEFLRLYT